MKMDKNFSVSGSFAHRPCTRASVLRPYWGLHSHGPVNGSCSALAMVCPLANPGSAPAATYRHIILALVIICLSVCVQQQQQQQQYTPGQHDAVYMSGGYYAPYMTTNADTWSPFDLNSYYAFHHTYLPSSAGEVYDYNSGYGWLPSVANYGSWPMGVSDASEAAAVAGIYAPDGYYTVEPYANGDVDSGVGDMTGQVGVLDNAMKAMSVTELPPAPTNPQPKTWAMVAGQLPAGMPGGRKMHPGVGVYPSAGEISPWNSSVAYPGLMDQPQLPYRVNRLNGYSSRKTETSAVVQQLQAQHNFNPKEFNITPTSARFFVIKSYSEDDIHRSIKYGIWCSTEYGNKRLDAAFQEREGIGPVYLFFSVNGSGHFCGMAEMTSAVDYQTSPGVWAQDKWKGQFKVRWIYVKDVPNSQLRHIRLENNENKPVTNSRDTQEVLPDKGILVLNVIHHYRHTTSIFDDFSHYEKCQEERRMMSPAGLSFQH